jgi:hypothetical protein
LKIHIIITTNIKAKKINLLMQVGRKRGLLIVFEGIDRVGKSTQCELLTQWFINAKQEPTQRMGFPGII